RAWCDIDVRRGLAARLEHVHPIVNDQSRRPEAGQNDAVCGPLQFELRPYVIFGLRALRARAERPGLCQGIAALRLVVERQIDAGLHVDLVLAIYGVEDVAVV